MGTYPMLIFIIACLVMVSPLYFLLLLPSRLSMRAKIIGTAAAVLFLAVLPLVFIAVQHAVGS